MEIPRGWGVSKAKIFKGKYKAKLGFPEGWGEVGSNQKTTCSGDGYGYFLATHNSKQAVDYHGGKSFYHFSLVLSK